MNAIIFKRSVLAAILGSTMAFGLGAASTADAGQQGDPPTQAQKDRQDKQDRKEKQDRQDRLDEDAKVARQAERQQQADSRLQEARAAQAQSQESFRRQAAQSQTRATEPRQGDRTMAPPDDRYSRVAAQPKPQGDRDERMAAPPLGQPRPGDPAHQRRDDYGRDSAKYPQVRERDHDRDRLPEPQRQQLITQQRQQAADFSRHVESRRADADRYGRALQKQHRSSQYRYQQDYYDRMRRYQSRYNWQTYNYYNDPYFYTAPRYRYYRGGSYFSINIYGANLLQQAINFGYSEGLRAGRADRLDGWRFDYRSSYAYRDANYGYFGFYVSQAEYNYYFRRGFERGYEDGYYGRRRYGHYYNGADVMLAPAMSMIFNFHLH